MRLLSCLLKYLLVVILCLWLVVPCCASDVLCLSGENQPKQRRRNESFTNRGVADEAQNRAYLSPSVFVGTLKSVLVQRDGTVRAWFAIDTLLKMPDVKDDRKRSVRMAHYTRLYERNRYTRDYVTTSVPAVRLKNYSSNVRTNSRLSGVPDLRTSNYPHLSSVPNSKRSQSPPLSNVHNTNYPRLSSVPSWRTSSVPSVKTNTRFSVPAVRTNNYSLVSAYTRAAKTVPLTINTLNWTVSDPPLLLGPFRRSTRTLSRRPEDTEVVYYTHGRCVLEVNQDNLLLGRQYVVFGVPSDRHVWPSLTASALPIPNDRRILRAVKKVLCKGCGEYNSISLNWQIFLKH